MYCICAFIGTGFSEFIILLIWASKSDGGFELRPDGIALITASTQFLWYFISDRFTLGTSKDSDLPQELN